MYVRTSPRQEKKTNHAVTHLPLRFPVAHNDYNDHNDHSGHEYKEHLRKRYIVIKMSMSISHVIIMVTIIIANFNLWSG